MAASRQSAPYIPLSATLHSHQTITSMPAYLKGESVMTITDRNTKKKISMLSLCNLRN